MQENKRKILDSSIKLFSEKGIFKTSLGDIAAEAGISKGTLFYYYPSKDDLLYDILDISIVEITGVVKGVIRANRAVNNREIILMIFKSLLKYDFLMKINYYLLQEALLEKENISDKFRQKYETWRNDIQEIIKYMDVGLSPAGARTLSSIMLACIDGICLQYLLDPGAVDLEDISRQLAEMLPFRST